MTGFCAQASTCGGSVYIQLCTALLWTLASTRSTLELLMGKYMHSRLSAPRLMIIQQSAFLTAMAMRTAHSRAQHKTMASCLGMLMQSGALQSLQMAQCSYQVCASLWQGICDASCCWMRCSCMHTSLHDLQHGCETSAKANLCPGGWLAV